MIIHVSSIVEPRIFYCAFCLDALLTELSIRTTLLSYFHFFSKCVFFNIFTVSMVYKCVVETNFIHLFVFVRTFVRVWLYFALSTCFSVCLSMCLSVYLSNSLSHSLATGIGKQFAFYLYPKTCIGYLFFISISFYFHFIKAFNVFLVFQSKHIRPFKRHKQMMSNTEFIKHSPHSTRCVVIAVSEWTERWEVRRLWRSLGKAESRVRGWWEIRQWNHHTHLHGGSGKTKTLHFINRN